MPPKKKLGPLSATIEKLLASRGMAPKLKEYRVFGVWADAVGGVIAGHAQPDVMRGRKLTVVVDSSAWMQQLAMLKPEIIGKVNRALGEAVVESVSLRLGEVKVPAAKEQARLPPASLGPEERGKAEELARAIPDPEVRRSFQRLIEKDLASRKQRGR